MVSITPEGSRELVITLDNGERGRASLGPNGTITYDVRIELAPPGAPEYWHHISIVDSDGETVMLDGDDTRAWLARSGSARYQTLLMRLDAMQAAAVAMHQAVQTHPDAETFRAIHRKLTR